MIAIDHLSIKISIIFQNFRMYLWMWKLSTICDITFRLAVENFKDSSKFYIIVILYVAVSSTCCHHWSWMSKTEVAPVILELWTYSSEQDHVNPVSRSNLPVGFLTAVWRLLCVFSKHHDGIVVRVSFTALNADSKQNVWYCLLFFIIISFLGRCLNCMAK